MNTGGMGSLGHRELTILPRVTGPGRGDSDFKQAPKCTTPSVRRKVQVHLNFGVGLAIRDLRSSYHCGFKWTFSKTAFSLSSRKRDEKSEQG